MGTQCCQGRRAGEGRPFQTKGMTQTGQGTQRQGLHGHCVQSDVQAKAGRNGARSQERATSSTYFTSWQVCRA